MQIFNHTQSIIYHFCLFLLIGVFSCKNGQIQTPSDQDIQDVDLQNKKAQFTRNYELSKWTPYQNGDDWYFTDIEGVKVLDAPDYEIVHPFSNGLAMIANEGCYGFIDETGEMVIPCQLTEPHEVYYYWNDPRYLRIRKVEYIKENNHHFYSNSTIPVYSWMGFDNVKKTLTDYYYFETALASSFGKATSNVLPYYEISQGSKETTETFVKVKRNNKWGLMGKNMQELVPCKYEEIHILKNSKFIAKKKSKYYWGNKTDKSLTSLNIDTLTVSKKGFIVGKNDQYGFINLSGDIPIPIKMDSVFSQNTYIGFKKGKKNGWASQNGEIIIPCEFDTCYLNEHKKIVFVRKDNKVYEVKNKKNKLALLETKFTNIKAATNPKHWFVKTQKLTGLLAKSDKFTDSQLLLPVQFETLYLKGLETYRLNHIFAKKQNKWQVFNNLLEELFSVEADSITPISKTNTFSSIGSLGILQNTLGNNILGNAPHYYIKKNNKWGLLDRNGLEQSSIEYDQISSLFYHKLFNVQKEGKWGVIDENGEVIIPIKEVFKPYAVAEETADGYFIKTNLNEGLKCLYLKKEYLINNYNQKSIFTLKVLPKLPENKICTCGTTYKKPKVHIEEKPQTIHQTGAQGPPGPQGDTGAFPNVTKYLYSCESISESDSILFKQYQLKFEKINNEYYNKMQNNFYQQYVPSYFDNLIVIDKSYSFIKKEDKWGIYNPIKNQYKLYPKFDLLLFDKLQIINGFGKMDGEWWTLNECGEIEKRFEPNK